MSLILFILALLGPPAPLLVTPPDRVQTYRMAVVSQAADGPYGCGTNWLTLTATNKLTITWSADANCGVTSFTTNTLLLWSLTNQSITWSTNLGLTKTQSLVVTTNVPYLQPENPPPTPPTNFIFTIYGSSNGVSWYTLTNLYVPNSKPFELLKVGLTPVVPR